PGGTSRVVQNPGRADQQRLPNKISGHALPAGQSVRLETPGGGGYGAPTGRDPAALRRDLLDGKVSRAAAERDYGSERVAQALAKEPACPAPSAALPVRRRPGRCCSVLPSRPRPSCA